MKQSDFEDWMDGQDAWDYTEDGNGLIVLWDGGRAMSHLTWASIIDKPPVTGNW